MDKLVSSNQPDTATFSFFVSAATIILSAPNSFSHSFKRLLFLMATLPVDIILAPFSKAILTSSVVFIPPPKSIISLVSLATFCSTFELTTFPCLAPSRSTICRRLMPASSNLLATSTGDSSYITFWEKSPYARRTHLPSMRSIAGIMRIIVR